ncbi:hypothetical protein SCATT_08730 [Streptantibioticus cattleyicolor NRRL 8057 = DSM 46488]|uniref:Uncharacterized protein n=2 Tax=Kitasatosporales TaxID=85011 RepID=G8X1S0_STREN|nr:hypothetical protein SCATT_08730 [Streptantibioticus cattleyicolor NRRL 8057 = DSM 46488]
MTGVPLPGNGVDEGEKMKNRKRQSLRVAVVAAIGVTAFGLATTTASAKSDMYFAAGPHTVHVGGRIHAGGRATDDNYTFNRFCIQQRAGRGGWRTTACSRGAYHGGGWLNLGIRAQHRGILQLRGVLTEGASPQDKHPRIREVSRTFAIDVR